MIHTLVLFCLTFTRAQTDNAAVYTNGKGLTCQGQNYSTIIMGNGQEWMAENLNVFSFRNGDPIPVVKTADAWKKAGAKKEPACCYYENNAENGKTYGVLYNWYAVNDPRGIAPVGWRIPTDAEWNTLVTYLGGGNSAGAKMKSSSGWESYKGEVECAKCKDWSAQEKAGQICSVCNDTRKTKAQVSSNGNNTSGFSGLPGGSRNNLGEFNEVGIYGNWWSSTGGQNQSAWYRGLGYYGAYGGRGNNNKTHGMSVRLIRD